MDDTLLRHAAAEMFDAAGVAIGEIRKKRFGFERKDKTHLDGVSADVVTSVDLAMQEFYVHALELAAPAYGMLGEEEGLTRPSRVAGHDVYWTLDPIDGTEAFVRGQSHGIGTMVALVRDGVVEASCIGDAMTGERYVFVPGVPGAQRCHDDGPAVELAASSKPLKDQFVLFGLRESAYSPTVRRLLAARAEGGLFREIEVDKGSIGLRAARLWKGEVGALVMKPRIATPWDDTPVIGFSLRLGFVFLKLDPGAARFEEYVPEPPKAVGRIDHETVIVHRSALAEFRAWEAANL